MIREFIPFISSYENPILSIVSGLKFSRRTSETLMRSLRISLPADFFRSTTTLFLFRLMLMK